MSKNKSPGRGLAAVQEILRDFSAEYTLGKLQSVVTSVVSNGLCAPSASSYCSKSTQRPQTKW